MNDSYDCRICIVGMGPAGIGVALALSESNLASKVLCLEAGKEPKLRGCSVLQNRDCSHEDPCQMISGFGGCSLLGGGKISTLPAGENLVAVVGSRVLVERKLTEAFERLDAHLSLRGCAVSLKQKRAAACYYRGLGFDYRYYDSFLYDPEELRDTYTRLLGQLGSAGTQVLLATSLVTVEQGDDHLRLVAARSGKTITISTEYLVLGLGRMGQHVLAHLNRKLGWRGKPNKLDVGVRLEFPTSLFPGIDEHHNDLKLHFGKARTFCVCKDGWIAPYASDNVLFLDGHRDLRHTTGFTNLAIVVRFGPSKQNGAVVDEIRTRMLALSNGKPVCQALQTYLGARATGGDYRSSTRSSISHWQWGEIDRCFPRPIARRVKESVRYFASRLLPRNGWPSVNVFAPEVGYGGLCFPVRSDFSVSPRTYLVGECTGRFHGILQAFCSGLICAESITNDIQSRTGGLRTVHS